MITCSVLRCTNPGFAFVMAGQRLTAGYREAYVCAEHKALIEAGSPWDMQGRNVLIGQDMAPTLERWSARPNVMAGGFTLTLEIAGHIKPIEFLLTPSQARALAMFIAEPQGSPFPGSAIPASAKLNTARSAS
jgi:hypothetical protein